MGLFATGYLKLYELTGNKEYLEDGEYCLNWLKEHHSEGYSGICWGYPFDWLSFILIPKGTPSSVVSTTVGWAFFKHYQLTGEESSLDICKSIASFLLNDLNIDQIDNGRICFSYTPIDNFRVYNASLMAAEFLLTINSYLNVRSVRELAMKAVAYVIEDQIDDGSFEYWGQPFRRENHIDCYHTGFVLRSLFHIYNLTGNQQVKKAFEKGLQFFLDNFFYQGRIPKLKPDRLYPVDIHSVAEAILSLSQFSGDYPEVLPGLRNVYEFANKKMWDERGYYYYRLIGKRKQKIPFIRWSHAWMFRALSEMLGVVIEESS